MQLVITIIIVGLAVAYIVRWARRLLSWRGHGCAGGCEGCHLHGRCEQERQRV